MYIGYVIGSIIWGIIWGITANVIIHNKGYDESWFWWGFFFSFIAVIVAACKPEKRSYSYSPSDDDSSSYYSYGGNTNNSSSSLFGNKSQEVLRQGGWQCVCGRMNYAYTGTCACGKSRSEAEEIKRKATEAKEDFYRSDNKTDEANELTNLAAIKELKSLLDDGIITQEEFDAKKKSLLGI